LRFGRDLFSPINFQVRTNEMSDKLLSRKRYGEAFWRAHHEAWRHSELNQREYCEAQEIPLKAFGNWRAKFKAEPQSPARKVLYRRGGLSHARGEIASSKVIREYTTLVYTVELRP
jgi:hypothetical protein